MKNLLIILCSMLSSVAAMASQNTFKVSDSNRDLAMQISSIVNQNIVLNENLMIRQHESVLSGDALLAWETADADFRDVLSVKFNSYEVIIVKDAPQGEGCLYYFNTSGEYLNSYCFSEDSDGFWDVNSLIATMK
jgi:hypothetical protein